MYDWEDIFLGTFMCGFALILVVGALFLAYVFGYCIGLYKPPCVLVSSQPACVRAGWQDQSQFNINATGLSGPQRQR